MSRSPSRIWRHRFACFQVVATWILLVAGAAVTSHDAGLAEPDWPTGLGYANYLAVHANGLFKGLVVFEHGHREIAMAVGLVTLVETIWLLWTSRRPLVRRLAWLLIVTVLVQGGFGGLTVLLKLPAATSIVHGLLAQTFFCLSIATAYALSREGGGRVVPAPNSLSRATRLAFVATACQLLLGLVVRHTVAKGEGRVPTFAQVPVMAHALFAVAVVASIGRLVTRVTARHFSEKRLVRPALALGALLMVQLMLGLLAIVTRTAPGITIAHVVVGATLLGLCAFLDLRARRLGADRSAEAKSPGSVALSWPAR